MPTLFDSFEPASNCRLGWNLKWDQSDVSACQRRANKERIHQNSDSPPSVWFWTRATGTTEDSLRRFAVACRVVFFRALAPEEGLCDLRGFGRPAVDDGPATANASAVSELTRRRLVTAPESLKKLQPGKIKEKRFGKNWKKASVRIERIPAAGANRRDLTVWLDGLPNPERESPASTPGDYVRRWQPRFALSGLHRSTSRHSIERACNRRGTDRSLPAHLAELALAVIEHRLAASNPGRGSWI
jgi:hypothetical protein